MEQFEQRLTLPISSAELFEWHRRPGAFERLGPSWQRLEIVSRSGGTVEDGARLHFRAYEGPLWINWVARHEDFEPGRQFVDVAERSPFAAWRHVHAFESVEQGAQLIDRVSYRLPLHPISRVVAGFAVRKTLTQMFRQRHVRTCNDLRRHAAVRGHGSKRLARYGAGGLLHDHFGAFWTTGGNALVSESQGQRAEVIVEFDAGLLGATPGSASRVDEAALEGGEVFIHVGGRDAAESPSLALARGRGLRVVRLVTEEIVCRLHPRLRQLARVSGGFIDFDDLLALIHHAAFTPTLEGEVGAALGQLPESFEPDFPEAARSVAHQRGQADEGAIERALARWSSSARGQDGATQLTSAESAPTAP